MLIAVTFDKLLYTIPYLGGLIYCYGQHDRELMVTIDSYEVAILIVSFCKCSLL